jgi:release factor glutamine methyltransferase
VKRHRPNAEVTGADLSSSALSVARENGARLGLRVRWIESDWLAALGGQRFDLILCNPPYVRAAAPELDAALRFEPRLALDGGADGLDSLRAVIAAAPAHLCPGGVLLLEHGYDQQRAVAALAAASGLELLAAVKDLAGRDRSVVLGAASPSAAKHGAAREPVHRERRMKP